MNILAFDLATNTGWCAGGAHDWPACGHVVMPSTGDDIGSFALFWHRWLARHMDEVQPGQVVFESPILASNTSLVTARKLYYLAAELERQCVAAKIPVAEVAGSTIKKFLTGDGHATKPDMLRWARLIGQDVKTHDEADAFGIWLHAVQFYAPEHQRAWDDRRFKARGVML